MVALVGYIRVSTARQGASGLGLEAQEAALAAYAASVGGSFVCIYREVESGKRIDRPQLAIALAHAKRIKARLVIGKLDRLARNVHFISGLMESHVDFVACDAPHANKLTLHVMAAVAEAEAEAISARTKAALAAAKARGVKLGAAMWSHDDPRRVAGAAAGSLAAKAKRESVAAPVIAAAMVIARPMLESGSTLAKIADTLNAAGVKTANGGTWFPMSVKRMLAAAAVNAAA